MPGQYTYAQNYYYGGGYYPYGQDCRDLPCWGTRCCKIFVLIVIALLAAIIITSVIVLPVTLTSGSPGRGRNPRGTRIVSFSNFFCSGITIDGVSSTTVTLIEKTPPLIRNVSVTTRLVYQSGRIPVSDWRSYLLPNSNVSIFVRNARGPITVWVIRGSSDWTSWDRQSTPNQFAVATGSANSGFLYNTTEEDEYYFAYNIPSRSASSDESTIVFSVEQFQYSTANLTSQPSCSPDVFYTCTLPVPYGQYNRALVVSNSNYWSWTCDAREWAYAVVVVVSFIFAVLVVLIVGVGIALCRKLKRKSTQKKAATTESERSSDPKASPQDGGLEMTEKPSSSTADTTDKS